MDDDPRGDSPAPCIHADGAGYAARSTSTRGTSKYRCAHRISWGRVDGVYRSRTGLPWCFFRTPNGWTAERARAAGLKAYQEGEFPEVGTAPEPVPPHDQADVLERIEAKSSIHGGVVEDESHFPASGAIVLGNFSASAPGVGASPFAYRRSRKSRSASSRCWR
jgi:hypothetical protein